jgi:hypothetical protein
LLKLELQQIALVSTLPTAARQHFSLSARN